MLSSVHLQSFPKLTYISTDDIIVDKMDEVREICNCVASLRKEANIRLRMPLRKMTICGNSNLDNNYIELIKQETNIKEVEIITDDIDSIANKEVILNMKECGKLFGSNLKNILFAQKMQEWKIINGQLHIAGHVLSSDLFKIIYQSKNGNKTMSCENFNLLIMIDTNLDNELILEGLSRDIVRIIQQTRKDLNLQINDNINVVIHTKDLIFTDVLKVWKQYICAQTLALKCELNDNTEGLQLFNVEQYSFAVKILKV